MQKKSTQHLSKRTKKRKVTRSFTVQNHKGLHARAAALFAKTAEQFQSKVALRRDKMRVNGKSILGVMMLGAPFGAAVDLEVEGIDAKEAMQKLAQLMAKELQHV